MSAKDDNHRLLSQTLPEDPESDAEPIAHSEAIFGDTWRTLKDYGGLEWLQTPPPPRRWLLELRSSGPTQQVEPPQGVLPLGKVGMLAAAGGVGKTMALVQLALAVATGREWLDTYATPQPGHVLLALGEEDLEEVRHRVYAAGLWLRLTDKEQQLAADRVVILPLAGARLSLTDEAGARTPVFEELHDRLVSSEHEWRLVALDPLSRFAGVHAEVDNHAATVFIETLEALTQVPGRPTVLVAHHTTKLSRSSEGDGSAAIAARGATALTDGARWVANLEFGRTPAGSLRLTVSKANYSQKPPPLALLRTEGGALRAETKKEAASRQEAEQTVPADDRVSDPSAITTDDY
jgi:RecA-family ATPase